MKSKILLLLGILILKINPVSAQGPPDKAINVDSLMKQVDDNRKAINLMKRLKVSGYIHLQYQHADSAGQPSFNGGNFAPGVDNRFSVRRGRVKVAYTTPTNSKGISTSQFVVQFDVTERGTGIKDAYIKLTDPLVGWISLTAGQFNNPFGYEISYSSSSRESPERGRMSQLHFPNEREIGAMLTIQPPSNSKLNGLRLDAGLFNGNGAPSFGVDVSDFDSKKDFSGRLSFERSSKNKKVNYGVGASLYNGGFRVDSVNVYRSSSDENGVNGFIIDTRAIENGVVPIAKRNFSNRNYIGADARVSVNWAGGTTTVRGEFITGDQPGSNSSAKSPNDKNPISKDIYQRNFNGAYFYLIQRIMNSPFEVVLKYDWYDPNTEVKGDDVGRSVSAPARSTNETDLRYDTYGFGMLYHFNSSVRIMAYYDLVKNETSSNLPFFTADRPDNVFTLRLQMKF